jgi:flagellar biosynthesis protein FliQ
MASRQIYGGVGIPMIVVGALMAILWAPTSTEFFETIEFVGGLIGILGVIFFVAGLLYTKEPVIS